MLLRKLLRRSIVCISNEFEYLFIINEKGTPKLVFLFLEVAEREGFEPPVPLSTTVFKTVVIDHSTISPNVESDGFWFSKAVQR